MGYQYLMALYYMERNDCAFFIIGLSQLGVSITKELARFLAGSLPGDMPYLYVFDEHNVEEEDLSIGPFLKEDLNWSKAGVFASLICEQFANVNCYGFQKPFTEQTFQDASSSLGYSSSGRTFIFLDCTNGSEECMSAFSALMKRQNLKNAIFIRPMGTEIVSAFKMNGLVGSLLPNPCTRYEKEQETMIARIVLAQLITLLSDGVLPMERVFLGADGFSCRLGKEAIEEEKHPIPVLLNASQPILVVCVGTGGTGGAFVTELVHDMQKDERIHLMLIDGDKVEEKNLSRQPFSKEDIQKQKVKALVDVISLDRPELTERLHYYGDFLNTKDDLEKAIEKAGVTDALVCLIGAVDNHRARQVLISYYQEMENCVYIDSANEWSNGETVVSFKLCGEEKAPLRSVYYPDVLTDRSPSASEVSCGAVNESSPQHLVTNITSAQNILTALRTLFESGSLCGGISYFDSFSYYGRFQSVEGAVIV